MSVKARATVWTSPASTSARSSSRVSGARRRGVPGPAAPGAVVRSDMADALLLFLDHGARPSGHSEPYGLAPTARKRADGCGAPRCEVDG